jgi:hypothetical protein
MHVDNEAVLSNVSGLDPPERTLQWATAVAVFFLPKHCTLCVVEDMIADLSLVLQVSVANDRSSGT